MRSAVLVVAAVLGVVGVRTSTAQPGGAADVEALLKACSDAGVIVSEKDPKTGKVPADPELGISKFVAPDEAKLRAAVRANKSLMENVKSRQALIGCAKLASREFAPGWVDLLRAVGRELGDDVCVQIAYNIAAAHELPLGSRQGFADLKTLVNKAIEAGAVEYHPPKSGGLARLTIADETKFKSLLQTDRALLGPGLITAAANLSQSQCDHTPVLKAIAALTKDHAATAFAAEFAARKFRNDLEPVKVAEELELAVRHFGLLLDTPSQARVLTQLGEVRRELGEEELAIDHFNRAYNILNLVHGGKHRDLANLQRLQAEIYCDRNEPQRALVAYMKAITTFMSLPAEDDHFADSANMMRLMARIDQSMGHAEDARAKLLDVLFVLGEVDRTIRGADTDPHRALVLRDLGILELRRNRLSEAKVRLDAALDIQMRREGAVHPETIRTLFALGQVCAANNEPGQSEFFTRQATIFLRHHYGAKHPAVVKAWSDRTAVHLARGNYRDAAEEIAIGLRAARISTANNKPTGADYLPTRDVVALLTRRGDISLRAADLANDRDGRLKSLAHACEHFALAEDVFARLRGNMPGDGDRLLAGDTAPDFFAGQLACQVRLNKLDPKAADPAAAFAVAERATARRLLETLGADVAGRLGGVPEALRTRHRELCLQLHTILREHNELPHRDDPTGQTLQQKAAWEKYQQADKELTQFEKNLAAKHPGPSLEAGVAVCTAEQALALLGPNEVAVTFLTGDRESFGVLLSRGADGPEVLLCPLPPQDAIEDRIVTLLDRSVMDQAMGRQLGEELYDQLLAPFGDRITGKDLLIVPTGAICRLPFELLRAPGKPGREYLGLTHRVRYAPSLTVLRVLRERDRARAQKPDLPLWVMANPIDPTLPALPRATAEAKAISAILGVDAKDVRIGAAATKITLLEASRKGDLSRYRIVHFAAHSGFVSENILIPGVVLGVSSKQSGFVDMDEIAQLDLNSDLVVLSACSSGGGSTYRGEGIRGLTGSFLIAGSRAVVVTQWPVADEGAARFMEAFYRRLKSGSLPADALRETRRELALQAEPRPPSEWAAFMLVGN